ncbi:MAG: hypothetical protein VYE29_07880 [Pseudomonadota bacterium]|nr:hypothetical protein [Pseudomonadota bacterium]
MSTRRINNLTKPLQFRSTLTDLHSNLWQLFELARESEYVTDYKTAFHASGQYDRPDEFLQCVLDLMRVIFEPHPLGTFFLNANFDFLTDAITEKSKRLGYLSVVSDEGESIESLWDSQIAPRMDELGYSVDDSTLFIMCTTGHERYDLDLMCEVADFFDAGFTVDEAFSLISSEINETPHTSKAVSAGYSTDKVLHSRLRLSLLLISDNKRVAPIMRLIQ